MGFVIPTIDENSQSLEVVLDNNVFFIILNWNQSGNVWSMSIRNSAYETLASGISLTVNYPLTFQFRYSDMPPGEIEVISSMFTNGPIPRDGFTSGKYQLVYFTQQDLLDNNLGVAYNVIQ